MTPPKVPLTPAMMQTTYVMLVETISHGCEKIVARAFFVGKGRPLLDRVVALDLDKDSLPKRLVPCGLKSLLDMKDHEIKVRALEGGKFPSNAQRKHKLDGVCFDHGRSSPASAKPTVLPVLLQR